MEPGQECKAAMAFDLPVLLCSQHATRQAVNASSLCQLMARLRR